MIFTSPINLIIAGAMVLAIIVIGWIRRPALPRVSRLCALIGLICLALSVGGISCRRSAKLHIAVMVDCSGSTRGASYLDGSQLQSRLHELLGDRPFDFYTFAGQTQSSQIVPLLPEIMTNRTIFVPPLADAIVLFSDGRFDTPAVAPPIFPVIDPLLDHPIDASIKSLTRRGDTVVAEVINNGPPRQMSWGDGNSKTVTIPTGSIIATTQPITPDAPITARLMPGDAWSGNDSLSLGADPPIASQRWWIGDSAPDGWRAIPPNELSTDPAEWLAPAIVMLNNVSADSLTESQQGLLEKYVINLGGALVIGGGDHAFAAGGYANTLLDTVNPLASFPPAPARQWVVLLDASGSMATPVNERSRFAVAADALILAAHALPPEDLLNLGSFARQLQWWSTGKSVKNTFVVGFPPRDASPAGPTNLEAALHEAVDALPNSMPADLVVLTDAQTSFSDPKAITALLKNHGIRLTVLVVGENSPNGALAQITKATGGDKVALSQSDSSNWASIARSALQSVMPNQLMRSPIAVTFDDDLSQLPQRSIALANHTWLKQSATQLAHTNDPTGVIPLAARWRAGNGETIAAAFTPTSAEIDTMVKLIARRPRDPRFTVQWQEESTLRVRIDAQDQGQQINGAKLSIQIGDEPAAQIPQTGPGRYEIELPSSKSSQIVTIRHDDQLLDRFAIAGRYPPEFDAIGNDRAALADLAARTGGAVIEPTQHEPIQFPDSIQMISLAVPMAVAGAIFLALSLIFWRMDFSLARYAGRGPG